MLTSPKTRKAQTHTCSRTRIHTHTHTHTRTHTTHTHTHTHIWWSSSYSQPHGIRLLYDNLPVDLTPEQEEVASMFAAVKDTEIARKPQFLVNFWEGFKEVSALSCCQKTLLCVPRRYRVWLLSKPVNALRMESCVMTLAHTTSHITSFTCALARAQNTHTHIHTTHKHTCTHPYTLNHQGTGW